jgi:hypothetical protein
VYGYWRLYEGKTRSVYKLGDGRYLKPDHPARQMLDRLIAEHDPHAQLQ